MVLAPFRLARSTGAAALLLASPWLLTPSGCSRSQPDGPAAATSVAAPADDDPADDEAPAKGKGKGKKGKHHDGEAPKEGSSEGASAGADEICPLFPLSVVEKIVGGGTYARAKLKLPHVCIYETTGGGFVGAANQLGSLAAYRANFKHAKPIDGFGEEAIFIDNRDAGPGKWELAIQKKGDLVGYDFHAKDGEHPSDDEVLAKLRKLADATLDGL